MAQLRYSAFTRVMTPDVPNTQSKSSDPSHSGCNQGTRHVALLSTTSSWRVWAHAALLRATTRQQRGVLRRTSSGARDAHLRACRANRLSWASREALPLRGTPLLREQHGVHRT